MMKVATWVERGSASATSTECLSTQKRPCTVTDAHRFREFAACFHDAQAQRDDFGREEEIDDLWIVHLICNALVQVSAKSAHSKRDGER